MPASKRGALILKIMTKLIQTSNDIHLWKCFLRGSFIYSRHTSHFLFLSLHSFLCLVFFSSSVLLLLEEKKRYSFKAIFGKEEN